MAQPLPANMLEWHYVIEGPPGSPYQGGFYHGIIRFPQEYPFKPPSIRMLTPRYNLCWCIPDHLMFAASPKSTRTAGISHFASFADLIRESLGAASAQ